mgnify:CR=1 FL=1
MSSKIWAIRSYFAGSYFPGLQGEIRIQNSSNIKNGVIANLLVKLGFITDLQRRRQGTDSFQPEIQPDVSMSIKRMENYDLYIFTPKVQI